MKTSPPLPRKTTPNSSADIPDTHKTAHPKRKPPLITVLLPLIVVVIIILTALLFIIIHSRPYTLEAGDTADYPIITQKSLAEFFCRIDGNLNAIDTKKVGEYRLPITCFGFIKTSAKILVKDTVPPIISPRNAYITSDLSLTGEMLVSKCVDETKVTYEILSPLPSKATAYNEMVKVRATDRGNNSVEFEAAVSFVNTKTDLIFEYGTNKETVRSSILKHFPLFDTIDLSDIEKCGDYVLTAKKDNAVCYISLTVSDTDAPTATVHSLDVVKGEKVDERMLITKIIDHSDVTVSLSPIPDTDNPGETEIKLSLADTGGNMTEYTAYIRVHDINTSATVEAGCTASQLSLLIFKDDFSKKHLTIEDESIIPTLKPGIHTITLKGKYGHIDVRVEFKDTTPPVFSVTNKSFLMGSSPNPTDLVTSYNDASEVSFSFKTPPNHDREGTFPISIVARDAFGNISERTANITFFKDRTPPKLNGCSDITVKIGEKIDYLKGVSAYDSVWGYVKVTVDASSVNLNLPGKYKVVYSAVDGSGNRATAEINVTVREPVYVKLNVSNLLQKPSLPNGCEAVSLAIVLKYVGASVSPVTLYDNYMPKSPYQEGDPWTTYVGEAKGQGYGCYAPCVVTTGNAYLSSAGLSQRVYDVSGQSMSYYEKLIDSGIPVIMWGTTGMNGNPRICWEATIDGKYVNWHSYSHCLVLIGYTDDTYIFCDPLEGTVEYTKADTESSFNINYRQACIVK